MYYVRTEKSVYLDENAAIFEEFDAEEPVHFPLSYWLLVRKGG